MPNCFLWPCCLTKFSDPLSMQKNKGTISLDDIKIPTQKLVYNLTIPDASVKDSGDYECAALHVTKDFKKTKKVVITVHGTVCF